MSMVVEFGVELDELYRRVVEGRRVVIEYAGALGREYGARLGDAGLPESSGWVVVSTPGPIPLIIYSGPSREAYRELLRRALEFLRLEYAVYTTLGERLGRLRGLGLRASVRYVNDLPAVVVIEYDSTNK